MENIDGREVGGVLGINKIEIIRLCQEMLVFRKLRGSSEADIF